MNTYLNKIFNLENKVAVVIGAGGHLCSEFSRGFAHAGCSVAILDLKLEKAKATEDELKSLGCKTVSIEIDVEKKEQHLNALNLILDELGEVDILINGAGINGPTDFLPCPPSQDKS